MDPLHAVHLTDSERGGIAAALEGRGLCFVEAPPLPVQAFLAWNLLAAFPRTWLWILDGPRTLDEFRDNLDALAAGRDDRFAVLPPLEEIAGRSVNPEAAGERMATLRRLAERRAPLILATCIPAILQRAPPPDALRASALDLAVGAGPAYEALIEHLDRAGYRFRPEVAERGDAAVRGGIVDAWSPADEYPVRIEYLGSTIESLRRFDPTDQRSIERIAAARLLPSRAPAGATADVCDYLPPDAATVWSDPERIAEQAEIHARAASGGASAASLSLAEFRARLEAVGARGRLELYPLGEAPAGALPLSVRALDPLPAPTTVGGEPDAVQRLRAEFVERLRERARRGRRVIFFFRTPGARDRFWEAFGDDRAQPNAAEYRIGPLTGGFATGDGALTVIAESDLYGQRRGAGRRERVARRRAAEAAGERIAEVSALQPGEIVVHVEHGIGRYLGLFEIQVAGATQEALAVEYAEGARLYVPVEQAHLLSRYRGVGNRAPELHKLGTNRWAREKAAAERAVQDLAARLLRTQAIRETRPGHAFPPDDAWMREFEAAFPYDETEDQLRAIEDVRRDMQAPRPMDRLICGDVGYGKTEVAMRAAFRAVIGGKQVAVLVPTTVLAQQHYETFRERMAAFPVTVEMLSRFRTPAEQADILRRLREGRLDIVIGTHRLTQPDVAFRDLGLVIIDEEQRFGVAQKEALKELRQTVDVLTLTATPIPRTLYLSLVGARDLSVIQTAPRERLPIETIVAPYDDAVVREAILRELDREGQVFYLHNRVETIEHVRDRLVRLVPEARIVMAHGQMPERELADIMRRFVRGEADVLLCTTIIESGVDIPNVNTILIDRADRFGIADLYQLRGRVGRYKHRAYAYLLLPRHGRLFDTARRRIEALRRHSGLGAGFQLALRDLETRGAGNLLGAEQSGHIAAVGFDLYCQLLRRTIAALKGEPLPALIDVRVRLDFLAPSEPTSAAGVAATPALPASYIEDESLRLQAYRRIASIVAEAEADALREDLRDRFGPPPEAVEWLLRIARIRVRAAALGVSAVETQGERLILLKDGEPIMPGGRYPRLTARDPRRRLDEILRWLSRLKGGEREDSGPASTRSEDAEPRAASAPPARRPPRGRRRRRSASEAGPESPFDTGGGDG